MSARALPEKPSEIDADWLTDALAERYPGVRVAGVEVLERHEATNSHARLHVTYDEQAGAPDTMFLKLLPLDPTRRESIAKSTMGLREARFYRDLAPLLSLRMLQVHVALHDEDDGSFLLLLEDLSSTGCTVSDGIRSVEPDAAARALEELADLHVRFEDPARRAAEAPWVTRPKHGSTYGTTMLQYALDHHLDRISDEFAAISLIYIEDGAALHALWHDRGPHTLIHGDTHIGNLFDDHGRTGFLDWGIINVTTPLREVSYFLNMSLSIDDRRAREQDLLRHYLGARRALGGSEIGFDDAWLAHRVHAAYTVPASCQIVMFPTNISERRRVFSEAFLARAEAAINDLEARAALRDAGVS